MKQVFLVTAFLVMIASSKNSTGQSTNDVAFNHSTSTGNFQTISPDKKKTKARVPKVDLKELKSFTLSHKILSEIKETHVNIKAVRHFMLSYKNTSDAKWFKTEGGYVANFVTKGTYTKIVYDEKGRWLYNLLEYTEANLAFEIRHMVKRRYYDDDILLVHQYEFDNNKTIYLIRIQDKQSNIKTLKICDEEIEDITQREKN